MRAALVLVALAVLSLGACGADQEPPVALSTAPVVVPGRPGEAARTIGAREAATAVPTPTANAADVKYAQNMIAHHRQALEMAILASSHAGSERVKSLASRIRDSQLPEIQVMSLWLAQQGLRPPDHHVSHPDMSAMPGMATPEQLKALAASSGQDFDRLFLQLMIDHHRGAITMSEWVLTSGSHLRIEELANEVATTQAGEIRRMFQIGANL